MTLFRRWRVHHLLLAWGAYWVGLILVTLWPAILAGWRLSKQPDGHGSAAANMGDGILTANIVDSGRTAWSGSISFLSLVLLVTVPPLVLWLIWLAGASRTNNAEGDALKNRTRQTELNATEPRIGITDTSPSTSKRRAREES